MSKEPPYFAFYASDFVSGTHYLTMSAVGCYVRLLCHQWQTGSVPRDKLLLARICGCSQKEFDAAWQEIQDKFEAIEVEGNRIGNLRLEAERQRTMEKSRKARDSANARWQDANASKSHDNRITDRNAIHNHNQNQNQNQSKNQSKSPNSIRSKTGRREANDKAFADFWSVVHKRIGKRAASTAFVRAVASVCEDVGCNADKARTAIVDAMRAFADSPASRPKDHSPIHPATWLNQGRYDDDRSHWSNDADEGSVADKLTAYFKSGEEA